MDNRFQRSELLLGPEAMEKLSQSKVIVFGVGGVGSYALEVLARTGIGSLTLVDYDRVDITNINRQLQADDRSLGSKKVFAMADRLKYINPDLKLRAIDEKFTAENHEIFNLEDYDYVVDAIDNITSKLFLAEFCYNKNIAIISAMGAGNKLDPTMFRIGDIYQTKICPLARVMRRELRKRNVGSLKVVWSEEEPRNINLGQEDRRKAVPASIAFVPSVAGIILGSEVIKDLVRED